MKILDVFGRLFSSVGEKLKRKPKSVGTMATGQGSTTEDRVLIWGVLEGPFHREDFPEDELEAMGIPDDWNFMIVARVSEGEKVGAVNLWYDTLDEAYAVVKHFKTSIEPMELTGG